MGQDLEFRIETIERRLANYVTMGTLNNMVSSNEALIQSLVDQVAFLEQQYNVIVTGNGIKLLTVDEYNNLVSLSSTVTASINDLNTARAKVIADNSSNQEKITATFKAYLSEVADIKRRLTTLEAQIDGINGQLAEISAQTTEIIRSLQP